MPPTWGPLPTPRRKDVVSLDVNRRLYITLLGLSCTSRWLHAPLLVAGAVILRSGLVRDRCTNNVHLRYTTSFWCHVLRLGAKPFQSLFRSGEDSEKQIGKQQLLLNPSCVPSFLPFQMCVLPPPSSPERRLCTEAGVPQTHPVLFAFAHFPNERRCPE